MGIADDAERNNETTHHQENDVRDICGNLRYPIRMTTDSRFHWNKSVPAEERGSSK